MKNLFKGQRMSQRSIKGLYLFSALAIAFASLAKADPSCPTDLIKPFAEGHWEGTAWLTPPNSTHSLESWTRDTFKIDDCHSFEVTVNYLDAAGKIARTLQFKAVQGESNDVGLYDIQGSITEGAEVSVMTGTIRNPQAGTLLGHFLGAVGGQLAYLSEVMTLTGDQLVRTVQMDAGNQDGPYLGTRVVRDNRVQASGQNN